MKPLSWLPIFALAASLGFSAAYLRRLGKSRPVVVRSSLPAHPAKAQKTFPPDAADKPPVIVTVSGRIRPESVSPYWKFNCVSLRPAGVASQFSRFHTEPWVWDDSPEATPPESPANSFRLLLPALSRRETGSVAYTPSELVMAVYAETAGIFPAKIAPGSVYDSVRWKAGYTPGAYGDLLLARRMIAETRKRNKRTHLAGLPPVPNRPTLLAWNCCASAAGEATGVELYPLRSWERLHFFLRQHGVGRQKAAYLAGYDPVMSFGPFLNVGGGDVPAGDKTYIDFYVLPVR